MDVKTKIDAIRSDFLSTLEKVNSPEILEEVRLKFLGKKSELMELLGSIKDLATDDKKIVGQFGNVLRKEIEEKLLEKNNSFTSSETHSLEKLLDITAPSRKNYIGAQHVITQVLDDVIDIWGQLGFEWVEGPEIETDWYCFEQLNMPPDHPARDMQDTFYIDAEQHILPRTHTSSVQIRFAENHKPPFRIVVPGRVYRNETIDARHTYMFHQFEAMIVDDVTTVADCKSIITQVARRLLRNDKLEVRFRHAFFPYTEPSFEIDGTCPKCMGSGCRICSNKGWVELGGLGMIHPQVLRNVHIDPEKYQGFALGFGPERFAMLRFGVNNLPDFFVNDLRFNRQFK